MTRDEAKAVLDQRDAVENAALAAALASDRQAAMDELLACDRLAYAWIPGDPPKVRQVAYRGHLLGVIHNTSGGVLGTWHTGPVERPVAGPFRLARAAAAALHRTVIPDQGLDTPDTQVQRGD